MKEENLSSSRRVVYWTPSLQSEAAASGQTSSPLPGRWMLQAGTRHETYIQAQGQLGKLGGIIFEG